MLSLRPLEDKAFSLSI